MFQQLLKLVKDFALLQELTRSVNYYEIQQPRFSIL